MPDNKNSTPLHWACYSKSEVAHNYILSMNPNLEAKDMKGLTPLHLAVKSVETLKSTRPARALLLKGSDRNAKDNDGKKAVDYITPSMPMPLQKELKSMLAKPRFLECLMIRTPL
jgi:ankyrin repeat protein